MFVQDKVREGNEPNNRWSVFCDNSLQPVWNQLLFSYALQLLCDRNGIYFLPSLPLGEAAEPINELIRIAQITGQVEKVTKFPPVDRDSPIS